MELDIKFDIDSEYKKILNQEEPVFDIRFNGKSNKIHFTLVTDNFKILDYNITDYCIYTDFCNYTDESNSKYSVNDDKDYCYIYTTLQINKKYDKKLRFRFDKNSPNKKADIDIFLKKDTINIKIDSIPYDINTTSIIDINDDKKYIPIIIIVSSLSIIIIISLIIVFIKFRTYIKKKIFLILDNSVY